MMCWLQGEQSLPIELFVLIPTTLKILGHYVIPSIQIFCVECMSVCLYIQDRHSEVPRNGLWPILIYGVNSTMLLSLIYVKMVSGLYLGQCLTNFLHTLH